MLFAAAVALRVAQHGALVTLPMQATFEGTPMPEGIDIHYGIGQNEMCVFFGYVYPAKYPFVAHSIYQGMPCQSVQIGLFR